MGVFGWLKKDFAYFFLIGNDKFWRHFNGNMRMYLGCGKTINGIRGIVKRGMDNNQIF